MLAPTVGQPGASSAPGHLGAAVTLGEEEHGFGLLLRWRQGWQGSCTG